MSKRQIIASFAGFAKQWGQSALVYYSKLLLNVRKIRVLCAESFVFLMQQISKQRKRLGMSGIEPCEMGKSLSIIAMWPVTAQTKMHVLVAGTSKFWLGYKGHIAVDMASMLIERVAATPANITDQHGLERVCPKKGGMVFRNRPLSNVFE